MENFLFILKLVGVLFAFSVFMVLMDRFDRRYLSKDKKKK